VSLSLTYSEHSDPESAPPFFDCPMTSAQLDHFRARLERCESASDVDRLLTWLKRVRREGKGTIDPADCFDSLALLRAMLESATGACKSGR
jgi:hypothetical protein